MERRCRMSVLPLYALVLLEVGSGNVVEQSRNVGDFSSVHVASGIQAKIEQGQTGTIVLRGDDNILPLVKTDVLGGTLKIGFERMKSISTRNPVVVTIRMPRVDGLGASGGSGIEASVPSGDSLKLEASGGGHIRLHGAVRPQKVTIEASGGAVIDVSSVESDNARIEGSGGAVLKVAGRAREASVHFSGGTVVKAGQLQVAALEVQGSGGGTGDVNADGTVRGSLSGGSNLRVPASARVEVSTSGGSEVIRK